MKLNQLYDLPANERITELMSIANISQAELSRLCGVHSQTVHYWVSPTPEYRRTPNRENLARVWQALKPKIDGLQLWQVTGDPLDRELADGGA